MVELLMGGIAVGYILYVGYRVCHSFDMLFHHTPSPSPHHDNEHVLLLVVDRVWPQMYQSSVSVTRLCKAHYVLYGSYSVLLAGITYHSLVPPYLPYAQYEYMDVYYWYSGNIHGLGGLSSSNKSIVNIAMVVEPFLWAAVIVMSVISIGKVHTVPSLPHDIYGCVLMLLM
jgi:hypothetical protein